jgi:hypothetical protein
VSRIAKRWANYWLAPGGRYANAALRVAIAISVLWILKRYRTDFHFESTRYYKLGPWLLWPGGRPSAGLLSAITVVAWISTIAMFLGVRSRTSHAISLVSVCLLAAHAVSDAPTWSHPDVPPLLASIAFLGARSGDVWSIDAWWRKRRGIAVPTARQTSARLVQLTVVSVFFCAGIWKLRTGGLEFGWALSDNMRHQLLARYDWLSLQRTPIANWIIDDVWKYRTAATLNMISQLLPISAIFLWRFPRLRALLAILFVMEVLGLDAVMNLPNPQWLPLAAAFIDWDALVAWINRRRGLPAPTEGTPTRSRAHLAFVTGFLIFYALQAAWLNQRLRAFPFSSFPLFATLRAKKPFSEHQTYELLGGYIEVFGDKPLTHDQEVFLAMRGTYRWMYRARDRKTVTAHLKTILAETQRFWPDLHIKGVRLWLSVYQAPAYPAPAHLERHDLGVLGTMFVDEHVLTALGSLGPDGSIVSSPPELQLDNGAAVSRELAPVPQAVGFVPTPTGLVLAAPLRGDPAYLVVTDRDGTRWIAGFRGNGSY